MLISEDGSVTGSIDHAKLASVEPKTDEARAQVEGLRAEQQAGAEQARADAERLVELARRQTPWAEPARDTRDELGRETGERDPAALAQSGTDRDAQAEGAAEESGGQTTQAQPLPDEGQQQSEQQPQPEQLEAQGDDVEQLRAEAEAEGVKVDRRWGADRLRSEIDAARAQQG